MESGGLGDQPSGPIPVTQHLHSDPVRVECEEGVVVLLRAGDVVLLRGRLDRRTAEDAPLVCLVDLIAGVDLEGQMLEPHVVVTVRTAVRGPQAEQRAAELQVDDLLGPAVAENAGVLGQAERLEQRSVERQRSLDVSDRQV